MSEYYTSTEVAEKIGLSRSSINTYCWKGIISAKKVKGKMKDGKIRPAWVIAKKSLRDFLALKKKIRGGSFFKGQERKEIVEVFAEYIDRGNHVFSTEEYIRLLKVRLRKANTSWKEVFGILKKEDIAQLSKKRLHMLAQEVRFADIEVRDYKQ